MAQAAKKLAAPSQPSVKLCHEMTLYESRRQGWAWPRAYKTTLNWLAEHDDKSRSFLLREGPDPWARKYLPHCLIDYSKTEPGELYFSDHHEADFFVQDRPKKSPEDRVKQYRPGWTTVIDARSRCVVGWHLGPVPHQDAIIAALRMAFKDRAICSVLKIDNGRDYGSRLICGSTKAERRNKEPVVCDDSRFKGIAGELGVKIIFATPYAPWSKAIQERVYGTFESQCGKQFATYCGRNAQNKPECLPELRNSEHVPTLAEAREAITAWLDVYHREEHTFDHVREVPLRTWQSATRLRRAVEHELDFLMDTRGLCKVTANGVGFNIAGKHISYGERSPALKRFVAREVFVTLDPADVSYCNAWTADAHKRTFIARLESNQPIPPHTAIDDAREVIAAKKREQSIMGKASRTAARRHLTFAQRVHEHMRERRKELLATGTDGRLTECAIVPVRTGFEGASMPVQKSFQPDYAPLPDIDSLDEFGPPEEDMAPPEDWDISSLLTPEEPEGPLESLQPEDPELSVFFKKIEEVEDQRPYRSRFADFLRENDA